MTYNVTVTSKNKTKTYTITANSPRDAETQAYNKFKSEEKYTPTGCYATKYVK